MLDFFIEKLVNSTNDLLLKEFEANNHRFYFLFSSFPWHFLLRKYYDTQCPPFIEES